MAGDRTYTVYKGERGGQIVYIGTTIQKPNRRFNWHRANGKDLQFTVLHQFDNADDMLDAEHRLIQQHRPAMNKIRHRRQNLNAKLSREELDARRGSSEWCQGCLKRRVRTGYQSCRWCQRKGVRL